MAFAGLRAKELNFTGVVDKSFTVPAGTVVACMGARVAVAATAGTMVVTADSATLMADAQILPQAAGLKRSATPTFFLMTAAATILIDTTGITGTPDITFFFLMYKAEPGAGEV